MTKLMSAMPALTAVVLAAFVGYIGAWYTGAIEGNFALVMLLATLSRGCTGWPKNSCFSPSANAQTGQGQHLPPHACRTRAPPTTRPPR